MDNCSFAATQAVRRAVSRARPDGVGGASGTPAMARTCSRTASSTSRPPQRHGAGGTAACSSVPSAVARTTEMSTVAAPRSYTATAPKREVPDTARECRVAATALDVSVQGSAIVPARAAASSPRRCSPQDGGTATTTWAGASPSAVATPRTTRAIASASTSTAERGVGPPYSGVGSPTRVRACGTGRPRSSSSNGTPSTGCALPSGIPSITPQIAAVAVSEPTSTPSAYRLIRPSPWPPVHSASSRGRAQRNGVQQPVGAIGHDPLAAEPHIGGDTPDPLTLRQCEPPIRGLAGRGPAPDAPGCPPVLDLPSTAGPRWPAPTQGRLP